MTAPRMLPALVVALAAAAARADSADVDSVTLGAMAERADAVVLADSPAALDAAGHDVTAFRVAETLRGAAAAGSDVRVATPSRDAGAALRPGTRYLLFLRARAGADFEPVAQPWGVRDTTEAGVAALVDYARRYSAALGADGSVARPADLVALLVESLASPANGVPGTAGRDLLRHQELVASMTPAQRQVVDAALAPPRKGDMDLAGIVAAAGVAGTSASDTALVARLLDPSTRHLRLDVTAALRRHARPELVTLLAARLSGATAQQRADLVNALGRLDLAEAAPHVIAALRDSEEAVRVEAAHSAGLLARAVRAPRDGVAADAPREKLSTAVAPLVLAAGAAKTEHEKRATCWALAQVDTDGAWGELRKLRDESADARVREIAAQYLLRPRVELILEP